MTLVSCVVPTINNAIYNSNFFRKMDEPEAPCYIVERWP